MDRHAHWETVYRSKAPDAVSWYQATAARSRRLIAEAAPDRSSPILDVGGGASVLVDGLLADGYRDVTVLDLSGAALTAARQRLGPAAGAVRWRVGDILALPLEPDSVSVWHDRAMFHFLTEGTDRAAYRRQLRRAVRPGGHAIIATFAVDGPLRCSGLDVVRYDPAALQAELGQDFMLVSSETDAHQTPTGGTQRFSYGVFRRSAPQPRTSPP
jgi:SAM-dependent methyltransferase